MFNGYQDICSHTADSNLYMVMEELCPETYVYDYFQQVAIGEVGSTAASLEWLGFYYHGHGA